MACFSFIWLFLSTSPSKTYLFYDIFFLVKLISCYFSYIHMLLLKSWLFWRLCIGTKNSDIDILSTLPFRSDFYCSCSLFLFCQTSLKIATKPKCIEWAKYFLSRPKRWFIFVFLPLDNSITIEISFITFHNVQSQILFENILIDILFLILYWIVLKTMWWATKSFLIQVKVSDVFTVKLDIIGWFLHVKKIEKHACSHQKLLMR